MSNGWHEEQTHVDLLVELDKLARSLEDWCCQLQHENGETYRSGRRHAPRAQCARGRRRRRYGCRGRAALRMTPSSRSLSRQ